MPIAELQFGPWLPDAPDYNNPGAISANNVFPAPGGYSPIPSPAGSGLSLSEPVRGAVQFHRDHGNPVIVGGGRTTLFVLENDAIHETTGLLDIGTGGHHSFAQFNRFLFAISPYNELRYNQGGRSWELAPGDPPKGRYIARVGHHLFIANLLLSEGKQPFAFQCSAENDPLDWPVPGSLDARMKSSLRGTVQPEYGPITGIHADRYPVIFQERAISRLNPVGPPTIFEIATIEEDRGCIAPGSIVTVGFLTYFLAHDGFWVTDGNSVEPISSQRVSEWVSENMSVRNAEKTHGAISWRDHSIIWTFYTTDAPTGFKRQIIYNWAEDRWSTAEIEVDWLVESSFQNPVSSAQTHVLAAFVQKDGRSELHHMIGPNLEAEIATGDHEPKPGHRVAIRGVYPLIEAIGPGGIRLETELGQNLVANGDFNATYSTAGWLDPRGNTSFSVTGDRLRVTNSGTDPRASYKLTGLVVGHTYRLNFDMFRGTIEGPTYFRVASDDDLMAVLEEVLVETDTQTNALDFEATDGTMFIGAVGVSAAAGQYFELDNVSVHAIPTEAISTSDRLILEGGGPLIRNTGRILCALTTSNQLGNETVGNEAPINMAGLCPVRGDGRFARTKLVVEAGTVWERAQGVQVDFRPSGRR